MPPPLLPCYSLDYLGWQLLDQPFCLHFFLFQPKSPRFPHGDDNYFAVSCAFLPLFRPPRFYPRSRSRHPRPHSHLRYCPCFRPRSRPRFHPVFVYGSLPLLGYGSFVRGRKRKKVDSRPFLYLRVNDMQEKPVEASHHISTNHSVSQSYIYQTPFSTLTVQHREPSTPNSPPARYEMLS